MTCLVIPEGYRFIHGVRILKPYTGKGAWDWQGELLETNDDIKYLFEKYKDRMDIIHTMELVKE